MTGQGSPLAGPVTQDWGCDWGFRLLRTRCLSFRISSWKKSSEDGEGSMEEMQKQFMEDEKQRQRGDPRRAGVTEWFGL
ncbi:unnamed protein product [Lota lota]